MSERLDEGDIVEKFSKLALQTTSESIKNKTDNLPTDPADESQIQAKLDLIKAKTDIISNITSITGSYNYLDIGGEQTVFEIIGSTKKFIDSILLDFINITQNGTIKIYSKIDNINYREIQSFDYTISTDSDGALIPFRISVIKDFKITYTENVDEGANRIIYYTYNLEG